MRIPLLLALLVAPAAMAQPSDLRACRAITDDVARLACFDAATAHLDSVAAPVAPRPAAKAVPAPAPVAAASPDPAPEVAAKPEVSQAETFGAEDLERAKEKTDQPLAELTDVVAGVDYSILKKAIVTLENGQVWRQLDSDTVRVRTKRSLGKPVVIRQARFGSYLMSIDGGRSIRVKRVK